MFTTFFFAKREGRKKLPQSHFVLIMKTVSQALSFHTRTTVAAIPAIISKHGFGATSELMETPATSLHQIFWTL